MKVIFIEQASGTTLWSEDLPSLYTGRGCLSTDPYRQKNSKRRATWWISRIVPDDIGVTYAYVEPSNERALRRMRRRTARLMAARLRVAR